MSEQEKQQKEKTRNDLESEFENSLEGVSQEEIDSAEAELVSDLRAVSIFKVIMPEGIELASEESANISREVLFTIQLLAQKYPGIKLHYNTSFQFAHDKEVTV